MITLFNPPSIRVFWMYHTMAVATSVQNNKRLPPSRNDYNFQLNRVGWFRIFDYFECNVKDVVPRQYGWPLPWPRHWASKHKEFDWNLETLLWKYSLIIKYHLRDTNKTVGNYWNKAILKTRQSRPQMDLGKCPRNFPPPPTRPHRFRRSPMLPQTSLSPSSSSSSLSSFSS